MTLDSPSDPISVPTEAADNLIATNTPDPLANEQTWPTEEEMGMSTASANGDGKRVKRVPKGTSAYQAAWIFDDEEEGEDDDEMDVEGGEEPDDAVNGIHGDEDDEETEEIELDSRRGETHNDLDDDEEAEQYVLSLTDRHP